MADLKITAISFRRLKGEGGGEGKQCGKSLGTLSIFGEHIKLDYLD